MMEKTPKAEFDKYSATYRDLVTSAIGIPGVKVDYFTRVKANYLRDVVRANFDTGTVDMLDVGCGVGNYHSHLAPVVRTLTGVDISAASLKMASAENNQVAYRLFDGVSLPFPSASFDVAFAICVLHHVPINNRPRLAEDIFRVLRPKGLFLIFEHNPLNPLTLRVVNRCEFDKDAILLRPREAEDLLRRSKFEMASTRHILTLPSWNRATRAMDNFFSRLPLGAQYITSGWKL